MLSRSLLSCLWVSFWVALGCKGGCGSRLENQQRERGCAGLKGGYNIVLAFLLLVQKGVLTFADGRMVVDNHLQIIRELNVLNPSQRGEAAH